MTFRFTNLACLAFTAVAIFSGCDQEAQIRTYTVAKGPRAATDEGPQRMLGAIVPQDERGWFFKVMGPEDRVAAHADKFQEFMKSVRFPESGGEPTWTLPEGWRQASAPGADSLVMRHATIELGDEQPPLELSVTVLPLPQDGILANVNRWRGQLQLPPLGPVQLESETQQLELPGGTTAVLVDLSGTASAGGMRPPFAAGTPPPAVSAPQPQSRPELSYDTPAGWEPAELDSFSLVALEVNDNGKSARVTISALSEAAAALLPNVNRWRRQVQLAPVTQEQLEQELQQIEVGGVEGHYVQLVGPEDAADRETILGVIAVQGGRAWFLKMKGDAELVARETSHFEDFVRSVKFE